MTDVTKAAKTTILRGKILFAFYIWRTVLFRRAVYYHRRHRVQGFFRVFCGPWRVHRTEKRKNPVAHNSAQTRWCVGYIGK